MSELETEVTEALGRIRALKWLTQSTGMVTTRSQEDLLKKLSYEALARVAVALKNDDVIMTKENRNEYGTTR